MNPVRGSAGKVSGFGAGFMVVLEGLRFVYIDHKNLVKYCILPMLIALAFIVGAWFLFYCTADYVIEGIWQEPEPGFFHTVWTIFSVAIWLVFAVTMICVTMFLMPVFVMPFTDILSEKVESILGTWEAKPFSMAFFLKDIGYSIGLEVLRVSIKLLCLIPLFLISFIPIIGPIVYFASTSYFLTKYTGMDFVDCSAARRGWTSRERMRFAKQNRWALCGLGSAVVLSFLIPFLFVIVWPGAVAGGTLLFLRSKMDYDVNNGYVTQDILV